MKLKTTVRGRTYAFADTKELLAKANEEKSGDQLAGIAAADAAERAAAKLVLADMPLSALREQPVLPPVLPPELDEVSAVIDSGVDATIYAEIKHLTVGAMRERLLAESGGELLRLGRGMTSEMIAACAKLMSNLDLLRAARAIEVVARCNTTIGQRGVLSGRAQPNHPADDLRGIEASLFEALAYGIGDAVIGINPVIDTPESVRAILQMTRETMDRLAVPTQNCVLAHVTTQMRAIELGAPMDLIFQSLAGTQAGNAAFGIDKALLDEADAMIRERGAAAGPNRWYFETGQGSELSAEAHHGIDQLTLEARCYGLARHYKPFMVNTVVGFIGPEYLYDGKQVTRAGLEDHFMGKLHGLPMGVDVCYTNHMKADQNDMDNLAVLLGSAGVNFLIGVPLSDDCMLNYQSTSYHDIATVRELLGLRPAPEFERWLEARGLMENGALTGAAGDPTIFR
ncbi:ethanolamine ammonia-lyase subunit EutB [Paenibacillus methanolicus]|uniref:Ethanolamine ammonia-lyase large subunit n=1 Tax=Paenibacillus methanolicus TaxID=582686 RepID=A0A5S5CAT0_9BACL|nr:ethanolamine ammonia-lyase subunit EutB [Paenibacillus methanolicus]TYP75612.1 ethanolamine ammonia-lyase large subunit [Paenibacillus methanolicus]